MPRPFATRQPSSRAARSKAGLALSLEGLAAEHLSSTPRDFADRARRRLGCTISEVYADELLREARAMAAYREAVRG